VKQDLDRLTRSCGTIGGMHPLTRMLEAHQSESDPADRYALNVAKAGSCYRIYAVAESGVKDLDVMLRAPNGDDVAGDLTEDAWPIVPPENAVCVDKPGVYLIEVSVYRGAGKYAVQVWGS
jgi:hypothetical protein